jgi:hypothetical protein
MLQASKTFHLKCFLKALFMNFHWAYIGAGTGYSLSGVYMTGDSAHFLEKDRRI